MRVAPHRLLAIFASVTLLLAMVQAGVPRRVHAQPLAAVMGKEYPDFHDTALISVRQLEFSRPLPRLRRPRLRSRRFLPPLMRMRPPSRRLRPPPGREPANRPPAPPARPGLRAVRIPPSEALRLAQRRWPDSIALSVRLLKQDMPVYAVKLKTGSRVLQVMVDAVTGRILP